MLLKIISIISGFCGVKTEVIHEDTRLRDLGFSSFDVVCLISRIEDEYDIEISDRKIRYIQTVSDIIRLVEAAMAD